MACAVPSYYDVECKVNLAMILVNGCKHMKDYRYIRRTMEIVVALLVSPTIRNVSPTITLLA